MESKKACTSCKVICVCCFCGIGGYLIKTGKTYPTRSSKILINTLGIGSLSLGILEAFDLSPIRSKAKENS